MDHEKSHGRDITWTLRAVDRRHFRAAVTCAGTHQGELGRYQLDRGGHRHRCSTRNGKLFQQQRHLFLASLLTTPEALLKLVRDRWSIEAWHWIRDTQLHEDAHRYRGNGADVLASLRIAALNLFRLAGCHSIRSGIQAVTQDIGQLLAMARRQPKVASF